MQSLLSRTLSLLLLTLPCVCQDDGNGLKIEPEKNHVVANTLVGQWQLDTGLTGRLGKKGGLETVEFREDASVVAKVPDRIAKKLRGHRIYTAGTMVKKGKEHAFLLITFAGNPTVLWFRERGGDPMGDTESWIVSAARARARQADVLFVGGDMDNQPFAAYTRKVKAVGNFTAQATVKHMADLIQTGRTMEFVETYCSPKEMEELKKRGRTIESVAARFAGERGQAIVDAFVNASKQEPVLTEDGNLATWEMPEGPGPSKLMLQRIDGRWYLRSR